MADEPPVSPETPTPTPEKKSHTGLIVTIVLIVIVVLLALFFGLYFGLRNNEPDTPEEVNPDPEIVEPGPVEEPEIVEPGTPYFEGLAGTYEITDTLNDLDTYLKLDWEATEDDNHTHDSVSVSYTSSDTGVVSIEGSTATIVETGETTITATISAEHLESDLTATAEITVIWTASTLTMSSSTLDLNEGDTDTLSVTFGPEGYTTTPTVTWTIESGGEDYISISSETDDSITVTALENGSGSATITASADGCNSVTCTVTIYGTFANDSWETINEICTKGEASTYYKVGDTKTITIDGESHSIRIIDFNHDDLTKNDTSYNNGKGKAAITIEMANCLPSTHVMNTESTNVGGWYSSELRSYLNEGIFSILDEDLQAVIKMVDKVATVGGGTFSSPVNETNTSSDSLFLLARVEVDGTTSDGYVDEGTQYAYYSTNNSRTKTPPPQSSNDHPSTMNWWLRSPYTKNSTNFHVVNIQNNIGDSYRTNASDNDAVSFAFCI